MVQEVGYRGYFVYFFDASIEDACQEQQKYIESYGEKFSCGLEYTAIEADTETIRSAYEEEKHYRCNNHTYIPGGKHRFGGYMSLYGPNWYGYEHRPDISYSEKNTHEEWWSHDKTKKEDDSEMKNNPYRPVNTYYIIKIFEEFFFFGEERHHHLSHISSVPWFFSGVKDCPIFFSYCAP